MNLLTGRPAEAEPFSSLNSMESGARQPAPRGYGVQTSKPSLASSASTSSRRGSASDKKELLFLFLFPWLVFSVLLALIGFAGAYRSILAWGAMVPFVLISIWCLWPSADSIRRPSFVVQQAFGGALLVACFAAALGGMSIYMTYGRRYHTYDCSTTYENVRADSPSGAYKDGGIFSFDLTTLVDGSRSVGLRNGDTYCAAPMLANFDQLVFGFVAVGKNCCMMRGRFDCGKGSALNGVSLSRAGHPDLANYEAAAKQLGAVYDLHESTDPVIVYVDEDGPQQWIDQILHDALGFYFLSVFLMAIIMPAITVAILKLLQGFQKYGRGTQKPPMEGPGVYYGYVSAKGISATKA